MFQRNMHCDTATGVVVAVLPSLLTMFQRNMHCDSIAEFPQCFLIPSELLLTMFQRNMHCDMILPKN